MKNNVNGFRLAYFGADTPWRYFTDKDIVSTPPPWNDELAKGQKILKPEPGIYAISATLLPGSLLPAGVQELLQFFRTEKPVARIGYSIYIYDVRPNRR